MAKVMLNIVLGSAVTQTMLGGVGYNYISSSVKFRIVYMCQKIMKVCWQ